LSVDEDPERALAEKADALADAIDAVIERWLVDLVVARAGDGARPAAAAMAGEVRSAVVPELRALLGTDIDQQATTPLALLRSAIDPATALLAEQGVPVADRDEFAERAFPGDVYGLSPAAFEDVDESLRSPGIEWGAAKAFVHLQRRRAEGRT
jgi:hypothetical protein